VATADQIAEIYATTLQGNHLALDFVNTVDSLGTWAARDPNWRLSPRRRELMPDASALLHWGRRLGIVSENELGSEATERDLRSAIELRELLYAIFAAVADESPPRTEHLRTLAQHYSEAVRAATLEPGPDGFRWTWADRDPADRIRWVVCSAAMELLVSDQLGRVKQCHDEGCGWVFLDMSKNGSRRWCSMQGCGARAKMRRQYRRKKEADPAR
jgi:predicted RNA-binding Zn ribbon-like protein